MNSFTWTAMLPPGLDIFQPGNLIAFEQKVHGGMEMRHNKGIRCSLFPSHVFPG